jgi:cytochrome P450
MTEAPTVDVPAAVGPNLPPQVSNAVIRMAFLVARRQATARLTRRHGRVFALPIPVFGDTVVVSDPALTKQIFTTSPDVLYNIQPNLSRLLGQGSVFALDGREHRARRKLLTPPFHGKSIKAYEQIVEEEALRQIATWPEGRELATLEPMMSGVARPSRADPEMGDAGLPAGGSAVPEPRTALGAVGQAHRIPRAVRGIGGHPDRTGQA